MRDLASPEYLPVETPEWLKEAIPVEIEPFRGINGMAAEWQDLLPSANAIGTAGIDRFQANQFINWRPETADYLENRYTPLAVRSIEGCFPALEMDAAAAVCGCVTVEAKVEALVKRVITKLKHPYVPPFGPIIPGNRGLGDEALYLSGAAWCNEQARVFVRFCQIQQIPARIVHLFYKTTLVGHTIAEFHNGHQWCLVDTSYAIVFRSVRGGLLSAAQCHDRGIGQQRFGFLYHARLKELIRTATAADEQRQKWLDKHSRETPESCAAALDWFGVINYPLPPIQ